MRSAMEFTIMIYKIVIWYLSTRWNETNKDSPAEICQGQGGKVGIGNVRILVTEKILAYVTYHK